LPPFREFFFQVVFHISHLNDWRMNLELLGTVYIDHALQYLAITIEKCNNLNKCTDPWEQEYPQVIEDTLEDGYVLNCRFNRKGTLLAAGCLDGRCVVWDFDTKGVSRNLHGHVKQVASIRFEGHLFAVHLKGGLFFGLN